ncbi:MAG: oligosaccharide flippase family protein [Deltaproteobacteria bacterium]|nr:oligosaccharide flippase family protein [Deltaproteobacteria bacterium]
MVWTLVSVVGTLCVGFFVTTFIIRTLTLKEYGIYSLLYSLITYIAVISSCGIPEVFQRFIPEAMQHEDFAAVKSLINKGLILRFILSCATIIVFYLCHDLVGHILNVPDWLRYFNVFAWGIVVFLEVNLLGSALHALFLHKYAAIARTIYALFRGILIFFFLNMNWGIQGVIWAEVISWMMWLGFQLIFYFTKFYWHLPKTAIVKPLNLRRYLRYAGFSSLNELGASIIGVSTDFFIISAYLGPTEVAGYAFADRVISMLLRCLPHVVLIDVIKPSFFSKYAQSGNEGHLVAMFNLLNKMGAFFVIPLMAGLLVLGDKIIIYVFKQDYLSSLVVLGVLAVSRVLGIYSTPTWLVLQAIEKVEINFYSKIFAVYNLGAALLVVRHLGVIGVVVVTCSAAVMRDLFCYYFAKKYVGLRLDWRGMAIIMINTVVLSLFLGVAKHFVTGLPSLLAVLFSGMLIYAALSFVIKPFSTEERRWINQSLPVPIFYF